MGVKTDKQVKSGQDILDYWKEYAEKFNPNVKVEENGNKVEIYGTEKAYKMQYGRNTSEAYGKLVENGGDTAHETMLKIKFKKDGIELFFQDWNPRLKAYIRFDDWKSKVEDFALEYNMKIKTIADLQNAPRKAVFSYA